MSPCILFVEAEQSFKFLANGWIHWIIEWMCNSILLTRPTGLQVYDLQCTLESFKHTYIRQSLFKKQVKKLARPSPDVDLRYLDLCTWIFYLDERRARKPSNNYIPFWDLNAEFWQFSTGMMFCAGCGFYLCLVFQMAHRRLNHQFIFYFVYFKLSQNCISYVRQN